MSVLAMHKRAKIDSKTCHMKVEKITKEKVFLHLLSVTTHMNSFFKNFLFCIGAQPINNVVRDSGEQRRALAIHTHVPILLQTPLPSGMPCNTEQSSLCST